MIYTREELLYLVNRLGILPFFRNSIPGWSVEEQISPEIWFTEQEGPWEWKGQMARERDCVYGKFFQKKNAWVSLDLFPHLCNYRRNGYDFEGMCEDGLVPYRDMQLMNYLLSRLPMQSKDARRMGPVQKGYDASLTRLQMQTFLINQDFVYSLDKHGRPYGWGNALLTTPEHWLGQQIVDGAGCSPDDSLRFMGAHLHGALPHIPEKAFIEALR